MVDYGPFRLGSMQSSRLPVPLIDHPVSRMVKSTDFRWLSVLNYFNFMKVNNKLANFAFSGNTRYGSHVFFCHGRYTHSVCSKNTK